MSTTTEYLQSCKEISTQKQLAQETYTFLENNFSGLCLCLLEHHPKPNGMEIVKTNCSETFYFWFNLLKTYQGIRNTDQAFEIKNHIVCFSHSDFSSEPVCIFIAKHELSDAIKNILNHWQILQSIQKKSFLAVEKKISNEYGNLISQLLHDVQSLMEQKRNKLNDADLSRQLDYQKELNKNLLFFIRDFDLFKSEISVSKFIIDSLALIYVTENQLSIEIQNPNLEISVDLELFSEAFNQIILNALESVNNDYSKVILRVSCIPSQSLFLNNNWVVFEIQDSGKGISEDFIKYVTKPFFTTRKDKYFSGFGLSNAKKIIEGHKGFLEITSNYGTIVKISIPQKSNEEK